MLTIELTGAVLGATVRGLELARPLDESDVANPAGARPARGTALP